MFALILLSGPIASGKTSIAEYLAKDFGFNRIRTGQFLASQAQLRGLSTDRIVLQSLGDQLDAETGGHWAVKIAEEQSAKAPTKKFWLLDSVRRDFQVRCFREKFNSAVIHFHITAPRDVLRMRFVQRVASGGEYSPHTSYAEAAASATELQVSSLEDIADHVFDTSAEQAAEIARKIAATAHSIGGSDATGGSTLGKNM